MGRAGRPAVEHRLDNRAVAARGPDRCQPGALRHRTTAAGSRAWEPHGSPTDKWVVRGAFGIVQDMEGTGKNLRLTQNPPGNYEARRVFDATTGPGSAAVGFADIIPNTSGGPGTLYRIFAPDLRPQLTKQWNVFVERQVTAHGLGAIGYVGSRSSHMVVPFDFNQPEPDQGPVANWARWTSAGRSTDSTRTSG